MNTLLSSTPPAERDRLLHLSDLTRDTRVSVADRLALRVGLWLLLRAERRTQTTTRPELVARRALARETYARAEREAALVRAATLMQYR
jgi:hypothetical protein